VFEIGNSLREARLRREIDFAEAEATTKIRAKYLRALEDEQFEVLPAQTYVKGFLRTYAEYLGLDGQLYVDEYNSRYVSAEEEAPFRARRTAEGRRRERQHRRVESNVVIVALVAIGVITALVIAAWKFGGSSGTNTIPNLGPPAATSTASTSATAPGAAVVVLQGVRGSSALQVHAGSLTGRLLFQGTLEKGRKQRFVAPSVWIFAASPENLRLIVNGSTRRLRAGLGPSNIAVSKSGHVVQTRA
jgi:cytoskeleton protein RodZ